MKREIYFPPMNDSPNLFTFQKVNVDYETSFL